MVIVPGVASPNNVSAYAWATALRRIKFAAAWLAIEITWVKARSKDISNVSLKIGRNSSRRFQAYSGAQTLAPPIKQHFRNMFIVDIIKRLKPVWIVFFAFLTTLGFFFIWQLTGFGFDRRMIGSILLGSVVWSAEIVSAGAIIGTALKKAGLRYPLFTGRTEFQRSDLIDPVFWLLVWAASSFGLQVWH